MKIIQNYLNPLARLGLRKYSFWFPFIALLVITLVLELYAYLVAKDPQVVTNYAIFLYLALIIYFSFRDGLLGGFTATALTICYYLYIIYTRNYTGEQLDSGIQTTVFLALIYSAISLIIGWLKQAIDTLVLREADGRRRLKAIVQQLPVGIIVTDKDGYIELYNKQAELILGRKIEYRFKAGSEPITDASNKGKKVTGADSIILQVIKTGRVINAREYRINRRDGKQMYIRANAAPIFSGEGKVMAAATIFSDITDAKEIERRKDDFISMASHELKTPITSLKLYLEYLAMGMRKYNDANNLKVMQSIKNQSDRLQKLVNDLLDVSRLQTRKLILNKELINLDELLAETINDLQAISDTHPLRFVSGPKVQVIADKFRISQVITNLVTNAIKYSPENTDIIVRIKRDDGKVIVSVSDKGIGIPKDKQKKIFDRLYQVVETIENTFPGFGMGLYISKEIIKRHKGNIWVQSQKDKGSTFYFSLPVKNNEDVIQ